MSTLVAVLVVALGGVAGCGFSTNASTAGDALAQLDALAGGSADASLGGPRDATAAEIDAAPAPCPDADHDGVCDAVDDWPCGAKPASPSAVVSYQNGAGNQTLRFSAIKIGITQLLVVSPGATISYGFAYTLTDTTCSSSCIDQIEIGLVQGTTGNRAGCPFDADVNKASGATGTIANDTLVAPATAGVYDFRFDVGQNTSCTASGHTNWWPTGTPPPAAQTLAHICVH